MPKWGTVMQGGYLLGWLKDEGDRVEAGEPLLEIETEKAVNVVEAPVAGTIGRIVREAGEKYPVGEILAVILADGEAWSEEALAQERRAAEEARAAEEVARNEATSAVRRSREAGAPVAGSPAARRLAREYDLDLAGIAGSGPGGRVVVEDVLRALAEATPLAESRFVMVGGRAVHVLDAGEGPPVVLLHGAGGSNWSWVPVLDRLRKEFRLLAPDFPGCGLSEAMEGDYSLGEHARFLLRLLEVLDVPCARVVGNSLGAAVGLQAAADRPELFDRLVLADAAGLGPYLHPEMLPLLLSGDQPEAVRAALRLLFHEERLVTHGLVDETLRQRRRPGAMEALAKTVGAMMGPSGQLIDVRTQLAAVGSRRLLVWGRQDRVTPLEQAEQVVATLPGLRLEVIDECGHVPQVEQPAIFARIVLSFLRA